MSAECGNNVLEKDKQNEHASLRNNSIISMCVQDCSRSAMEVLTGPWELHPPTLVMELASSPPPLLTPPAQDSLCNTLKTATHPEPNIQTHWCSKPASVAGPSHRTAQRSCCQESTTPSPSATQDYLSGQGTRRFSREARTSPPACQKGFPRSQQGGRGSPTSTPTPQRFHRSDPCSHQTRLLVGMWNSTPNYCTLSSPDERECLGNSDLQACERAVEMLRQHARGSRCSSNDHWYHMSVHMSVARSPKG